MAFIQCWTCNGTSCDIEKTLKHIPSWERTIPKSLLEEHPEHWRSKTIKSK